MQRYFPSCDGLVILPGNEIPTWFRFQSMGSSITLPPGCLSNKKLLSFAFSAIVAFPHHHFTERKFLLFGEFKVKSYIKKKKEKNQYFDPHVIKISLGVVNSVDSDHFWVTISLNFLPSHILTSGNTISFLRQSGSVLRKLRVPNRWI